MRCPGAAMAGIHTLWLVLSSAIVGSGAIETCSRFSSFPESMAVSIGANFCVLCDYPELESEQWSTSCAGDQDEMCSCTIIDVLPGLQLCFNGFQASCSRDYQCNVSFMTEFQTSLVCSAEAVFVATSVVFTEHPDTVTAVQGNTVSFECTLSNGNTSVSWQRRNATVTTFLTSSTLPGNYIVGETNTLRINGVVADNAGEYRCAYEVQDDVYLYSDFGELDYLEEGITLSLEATAYSLSEGATAEVCIRASGSIPESYSIDFSVEFLTGTAEPEIDYEMVNFSRTLMIIDNSSCVEAISIVTLSDGLVEADEEFTVFLTSNSFVVAISNSSLIITIENHDMLRIGFERTNYIMFEGTFPFESVEVCISVFSGELSGVVASFNAYTEDGTATELDDYDYVNIQGTIENNEEEECFEVMINDDPIPEVRQYFTIHLNSSDPFVTTVIESARVNIDDDVDVLAIQFAQASYAFDEDAGTGSTLSILYDTRPEGFTIEYSVMSTGRTATEDGDYIRINETIEITESSVMTYSLPFIPLNDNDVEGNETVYVELSSSNSRVNLNTPSAILITIVDNDRRVDIDFTQSSYTFNEYDRIVDVCATTSNQTTYDVNFVFSVETQESQSHSATVEEDYRVQIPLVLLQNGETTVCSGQTLILSEDDKFEGTESFYVLFTSPGPSIVLNSNLGSVSGTFIQTQIFIIDNSGFIVAPQSIEVPLNSGPVEFNCSASMGLEFLVDGQNITSLPDSRGITIENIHVNIDQEDINTSVTLSVPTTAENNNTEVLCRLTNGELQSTSRPAILSITHSAVQCGNLFCQNGGECLDDTLCSCPSEFTGPECDSRIIQPPVLGIMASSPQLGAAYQATCMLTLDTELSLEEIDGTVGVQWLDSNGQSVNATNVAIGELVINGNRATITFNISALTTSHAGFYTCVATLVDGEILQQRLNITFTLPAPSSVIVSRQPSRNVSTGESLELSCTSVLPDSITSPVSAVVEWTVGDGATVPDNSRFIISPTSALTPAIFVSQLSINPLLERDSGVYTCEVYFMSDPGLQISDYLTESYSITNSVLVFINEVNIPLLLTTLYDSIPADPPYNTFQLTCNASAPAFLNTFPFEIRWFRETGPAQQQLVIADSVTTIDTSDNEPVSVLTTTRTVPGQYVFYCEIEYLYGEDSLAQSSSISTGVTLNGDSNPALPANTSVFGIGVDFVIIQWTIQRLLFTPETYYVEYSELTDDEEIPTDAEITSVQYPTVNTNFSAVNMEYRFVVNGLNPDSAYGFRLVAVNSIGESETPASLYFQTRHEEPFNVLSDEGTMLMYPIGAMIELEFTHVDDPLDDGGNLTIGYEFLPYSHTPLQQPSVTIYLGSILSVRIQYSSASPSLTGSYVLCGQNECPLLCGGRVTFTITVPSLSISTDLLVSQYVDGVELNNTPPEIVCLPSDHRAPVQWSSIHTLISLERNYGAEFVPTDLNHTLRFPAHYEQLPTGTLRVVCDLINVEEPDVAVDPVQASVIFTQNPVAVFNNDRELEPDAVINVFSQYEGLDHLSLGCVGTVGNGELQWEAREVARFSGVIDESVLSTNDDISIGYYSSDRRDSLLTLRPVTQSTVGYYTCRSTVSDYVATVLTTYQNPYFAFTSLTYYEVPLGVRVDISARYAYWSNGRMNIGTGFRYNLTFLPYLELSMSASNTTSMPPLLQEQLLDVGFTDASSNNYIYTIYAGENSGGQYNLTFQYIQTQEVYRQTTEIIVTTPYIVIYEAEVVARRSQLVTISCIPNDLRAPVLWSLEVILRQVGSDPLLHDFPQYFTFDTPALRHTVTFNVSVVLQEFPVRSYSALNFDCGFMDGDDDENIFNSTTVSVLLQDDTIQLDHTYNNLRIFNNTVINQLGEGLGDGESPTSSMPLSKRGSPLQDTLYVDCMASQGDHEPVWVTDNPIVRGDTNIIPAESEDSYEARALSDYVTRLSFEYFDPHFEGVYMCLSGRSNAFVEIYITRVNPYVAPVSPSSLTVIEDSSVALQFKIAVDSDGNSWNTENIDFRFSGSIEDEYSVPFSVCNSEFPQNYCYTIESVERTHEGMYIASASRHSEDSSETSYITLNVTRRCPVEVNGGIQWPWILEGTTALRLCSDAGPMFRVGPQASRLCNELGEWEEADLTSCTLTDVKEPFLLIWFVIEADEYTDDMEQSFVDSMKMLLDINGVEYSQVTLQSAFIASVAVTFHVDLVEGDQKDNISQFRSFLENTEGFTSFSDYSVTENGRGVIEVTVADTCMCSSANLGSSLQLCSGAAIGPCDCIGTACRCQSPFVGDGLSCTLDSDSDGYPDQALDSPSCDENQTLAYCLADVCPEVTNPGQNPQDCEPDAMEVFSGCPYGPDDVWGIQWPNTPGGSINIQPCPGGVDALGTATRECYENGMWAQPNVLSCQSLEILRVSQEASELLPEADAEIEEVTPELIASVSVVSEQLAMATDSEEETGLLPLDLNSTNNVVAQVLNVLESSVEDEIDDVVNEELVEVFNNILNETNQAGWTELQSIGSGSQTLLQNAERYGTYLASTVNDTDDPVMLVRENIIVTAEVVDTLNVSDIVFPTSPDQLGNFTAIEMGDTAQITIPAEAISRLNTGNNSADLAIVHIIFRNIEDFLPANTSALNNSRAASIVISSQLNQRGVSDDVFKDNPITLNFTFATGLGRVNQYVGVFWNFSDPVGSGGWSSEGVQVISNITRGNVTTVQCSSTHLTSFAVLVDVSGGLVDITEEEQLALQVVSYIGCIISSVCLSITVVFYLAMGKRLFSAVHYFVHLNLAISLLLGYVVFMLGVELGTSTKGGCAFVAALLQYLFLSAFCWMMCEGIMLYLMLVVVFSKLSNKWWFFLLLGYCTPLLFVVVGVASRPEYYGVRGDDDELAFCWLSTEKGTIFAFVAPMIVIILINTVFLGFALVALGRSKKQKTKALDKDKSVKQATTILRATLILLPLLGLTWLFGLLTLSNNTTVFAWLFTVFNSLQGAAIFFFHVIRNEKVWNKISPRLSRLKQHTFKSSLKYDVSTSYSGSVGQSSTGTMRALLHKKPLNSKNAGGQAMSSVVNDSLSFTESELEPGTDVDKKIMEAIPEEGEGGRRTEVIRNPNTSNKDGHKDHKTEEVTKL